MRFIWCHAIVHVLSTVNASSDSLHIFIAHVSASLLKVDWQGRLSSHIFTPTRCRGWHMPIWLFCFKRYSTPCIFTCAGFSVISHMENYFNNTLHYWETFYFSMSPMFLRGFPISQQVFPIVPAWYGLFFHSEIVRYICSCLQGFDHLIYCLAVFLSGSWLSQRSQFPWELSKFLRTIAPQMRATSWEVFFLPYFFSHFTGKVLVGYFPYLRWNFYCSHLSSCYVRRRG